MNQKKAKSIRREMRKLHGHTRSLKYERIEFQPVFIFTESKFKKVFKRALNEKLEKLRKMGASVPIETLWRRVAMELPDVGSMLRRPSGDGFAFVVISDEARRAYKAEKRRYMAPPPPKKKLEKR